MSERSEEFRREIEEAYELNAAEKLLLDEACRCVDKIDNLPADAHVETRQQATLLYRLIDQLQLQKEDGTDVVPSPASLRGRKAARARWDRERQKRTA
jgi:hypothetical protein